MHLFTAIFNKPNLRLSARIQFHSLSEHLLQQMLTIPLKAQMASEKITLLSNEKQQMTSISSQSLDTPSSLCDCRQILGVVIATITNLICKHALQCWTCIYTTCHNFAWQHNHIKSTVSKKVFFMKWLCKHMQAMTVGQIHKKQIILTSSPSNPNGSLNQRELSQFALRHPFSLCDELKHFYTKYLSN